MGGGEKESGVGLGTGPSEPVGTAAGAEEKESGVDPGTGTSEPVGAAAEGEEKESGVDPSIGTSEPGGAATRGGEDDEEEGEEELGVELAAGSVPVFVVSETGDVEEAGVRPGSGLRFVGDENRFVVATSKEVEGSTSSFDKMLGSPPPTAT